MPLTPHLEKIRKYVARFMKCKKLEKEATTITDRQAMIVSAQIWAKIIGEELAKEYPDDEPKAQRVLMNLVISITDDYMNQAFDDSDNEDEN